MSIIIMYTCLVQVLDLASRCLDRRYLMILSLPPKMTGPTSKNGMILKKKRTAHTVPAKLAV